MAELGVRKMDELIGRTDLLAVDPTALHYKNEGLDLSGLLLSPQVHEYTAENNQSDGDRITVIITRVCFLSPPTALVFDFLNLIARII
jgi:hypothetical protein